MRNVTPALCRAISGLLLVCCLFSIAVPASATDTSAAPELTSYVSSVPKDADLPATCYWCRLRLSVEDGSYIIPYLVIFALLLALSLMVLRKNRGCRLAKPLATATLLPQLFLAIMSVLIATGGLKITHRSGPIIRAVEIVLYLVYFISIGAAWVIGILKSADSKTKSK